MRDRITGFLHGVTFYPLPCIVPHAFEGWSARKFEWHVIGALTMIAISASAIVALLWPR